MMGWLRQHVLPWRQIVYVYAVAILFYLGGSYMLNHRHDWWGWVILAVYAGAAEIIFILWRRKGGRRGESSITRYSGSK
jgi:hypothetical protein